MNLPEQPWFSLPLTQASYHPGGNNADHSEAIQRLNSLLRGEIAASETYRMAIDKLIRDGQDPGRIGTLRETQREHIRAEQIFRKRLSELGGVPDDSSGTWGAWSKVVIGAAQLFGNGAALHALRDGEEQGLQEMRAAVENIDAESATLIEKVMIPAQTRHIRKITCLIAAINS